MIPPWYILWLGNINMLCLAVFCIYYYNLSQSQFTQMSYLVVASISHTHTQMQLSSSILNIVFMICICVRWTNENMKNFIKYFYADLLPRAKLCHNQTLVEKSWSCHYCHYCNCVLTCICFHGYNRRNALMTLNRNYASPLIRCFPPHKLSLSHF